MAKDPFRQLDVLKNIVVNGKKVKDCYRLMYKKELWLRALATRGENHQPKHLQIIDESIERLKSNTFRLTAKDRLKKDLVIEVVSMILSSIYSPIYPPPSHVNKENNNVHTVLGEIKQKGCSLTWGIKGEWHRLLPKMDKQLLLSVLSEKIADPRFLLLIHHLATNNMLKEKRNLMYADITGSASLYSMLASVYLHPFDLFMEKQRHSFETCHRDFQEGANLYVNINKQRKLVYIRYAGDFLIGIAGSKQEAKEIKNNVEQFLRTELKLMPSKEAPLVLTHFEKGVLFLDYSLRTHEQPKTKRVIHKDKMWKQMRRLSSNKMRLEIPSNKLIEFAFQHNYGDINTFIASSRPNILYKTELNILKKYHAELRAISHYYRLADNYHHLRRLFSLAQASFLKTIANKRRSTVSNVARNLRKHKQGTYCLKSDDRSGNRQLHAFNKFGEIAKTTPTTFAHPRRKQGE